MNRIVNDIKSDSFARVYVLYGEEAHLRGIYLKQLLNALGCEEDNMNFTAFNERPVSEEAVISMCETLPFFADRRVVLINDSGLLKEKAGAFADYIPQIPEYMVLIFSENEADKRGKLFKACAAYERAIEFSVMKEADIQTWVLKKLAANGKKIKKSVMEAFMQSAGTDLGYIDCELEKLIAYTGDRDIVTAEDVSSICSPVIENRIFDMTRTVSEGNVKEALDIYADLKALKEAPMHILFLLSRQFDQLLRIRMLDAEGKGQQQIADVLKMHPYAVKKNMQIARRYSVSELEDAVRKMVTAEEDVKTGRISDALAVELMIIKAVS